MELSKMIYSFNGKLTSIDRLNKEDGLRLLGGKGYNLQVMSELGLPVPPGFTFSSEAAQCSDRELQQLINVGLSNLDNQNGHPTSVSVRSGSSVSMPGMMETFLDLHSGPEILVAVRKVFESWWSDKAKTYRKINGIPDWLGTAVTIQSMVYGDSDDQSATGVTYSRNPMTGRKMVVGEFLLRSKGKDIVDGSRTPMELEKLPPLGGKNQIAEICKIVSELERHYKWPQDIEWTIDSGNLWILQTRDSKMPPIAQANVAIDLVAEGILTKEEAFKKVDLSKIKPVVKLQPVGDDQLLCKGVSACSGVASGVAVSCNEMAIRYKIMKKPFILVKEETRTEDVEVMQYAEAIVTRIGGLTSHAAAVARHLNKPCIVGTGRDWNISDDSPLTLDASVGKVYRGTIGFRRITNKIYEEIRSWGPN